MGHFSGLEASPFQTSLGGAARAGRSPGHPLPLFPTCLLAGAGPQLPAQPGRAAAALISHRATFLGRRNCRWQLIISQASPFINFSLQNGGFLLSRGIGSHARQLWASHALCLGWGAAGGWPWAAAVLTPCAAAPTEARGLFCTQIDLPSPTRSGKLLGSPCACCSVPGGGRGGDLPGSALGGLCGGPGGSPAFSAPTLTGMSMETAGATLLRAFACLPVSVGQVCRREIGWVRGGPMGPQ